jgi:hypothetical protein
MYSYYVNQQYTVIMSTNNAQGKSFYFNNFYIINKILYLFMYLFTIRSQC